MDATAEFNVVPFAQCPELETWGFTSTETIQAY